MYDFGQHAPRPSDGSREIVKQCQADSRGCCGQRLMLRNGGAGSRRLSRPALHKRTRSRIMTSPDKPAYGRDCEGLRHGWYDDGSRVIQGRSQSTGPRAGAIRWWPERTASHARGSPGTSGCTIAARSATTNPAAKSSTGCPIRRSSLLRLVRSYMTRFTFRADFWLPVSRPAAAYKMELKEHFPGHEGENPR